MGHFSTKLSRIKHHESSSTTPETKTAKGRVEQRPPGPSMAGDRRPRSGGSYPTDDVPQVPESSPDPYLTSEDARQNLGKLPKILTLVAMPAYNEEDQIAKAIVGSRKFAAAVLVVDDGSTDLTSEIAEALGAIVIRHKVNKGYGRAIQTIFLTARRLGVDELVIIDSDGQHNPMEIPLLLHKLREGYDVVIGSRFIPGMESPVPIYRKVGMKILDRATMMASGIPNITDSQSGFRAYGKQAIKRIKINRDNMSAGSDILVKIHDNNLTVNEVPITVRYDIKKTSSQNPLSHGIDILWHLAGVIGYRRPVLSFGLPGTILVIIGIVIGLCVVTECLLTSAFPFSLSMISVWFMVMGLLLVSTAFIMNSLVKNGNITQ